jgi:hypothetical protein
VEFYSSSVSNELKGEEETGRWRLDGEMKKVGTGSVWLLTRGRERQMAVHDAVERPEGRRCRWEPEVRDDALVGRTGPKGRAERAGFGGSEGETKMGRKPRRLQHKLFLFF